jgi:hypothetical protein
MLAAHAELLPAVPPAAVRQPAARVSALQLAEGARHGALARRAGPALDVVRVLRAARALQGARSAVLLLPVLLRRRPYAVPRRPSSPSPRKR